MTILVALLLTISTFAFITYPLWKRRQPAAASVEDEKLRELRSKRNTTYSMLKELEFDLQSGILTDDDYRDLETRYKRKAISILRETDVLDRGTGVEAEIEKQVLELRRSQRLPDPGVTGKASKGTKVEAEIENEILRVRRGKGRFCPQCGARCQEGDRFCSRCGTRLRKGESVD